MTLLRSAARSAACWAGLGDEPLGWRAWWAPVLWWSAVGLVALSVGRFVVNPLFCGENAVIVVVLALVGANAPMVRRALARPRPIDRSRRPA